MFIKLTRKYMDSKDEVHLVGTILEVDQETGDKLIAEKKAEVSDGIVKEIKAEDYAKGVKEAVAEAMKAAKEEALDEKKEVKVGDGEELEVIKDAGDQPWKHCGEFMLAVKEAGLGGAIDERLLKSTGQNETTPADGGYLLEHPLLKNKIFDVMAQEGILAPKCDKMTVGPQANGLKIVQSNESTRSATSLFSGIRLYSPDEGVAKTAFKQALTQKDISLKKLTAVNYFTDELLMDAPFYLTYIASKVGYAYAWMIDNEIVNGTLSIVSPIVNDAATVEITVAGNNPTKGELNQMYAAMVPGSVNRAEWYMSNAQRTALYSLTDRGTPADGDHQVFMPQVAGAPFGTLFGRPINVIEQAGAATAESSFMFLDLSQYLLLQKGGIETATSIHVKFLEDETAYRWTMRFGGAPTIASTITLPDATIVSPFVTRD